MPWTPEDTIAAYKQGWAPFTQDDGGVAILALDDPDLVAEEHDFAPFAGHRFEGDRRDIAARRFVQQQAVKGDDLAKRALALVENNPSLV